MKMPLVLTCALLSAAAGCKIVPPPPPERSVPVSNKSFQLDQLFTDDRGDTVYRFFDMGGYRYYVVGRDGHAQMLPTTTTVVEPDSSPTTIVTADGGDHGHDHGGHHH